MITYTTPNTHFQQKWVQKLSDGSKVCMTLTMLCFFFLVNIFNSITQAQSVCPYNITLVSNNYNATTNQTTFVWSVVNPNPGNGRDGGVQDLSWWGFAPNTNCTPSGASLSEDDIVRAGYGSSANASTHSTLNVDIKEDKSCSNSGNTPTPVPILKFDRGTKDDNATYYSLVLTGRWSTGTMSAYYKSGVNTGCGSCTVAGAGVGCLQPACPAVTFTGRPTANLCPGQTATIVPSVTGGTFSANVSGVINATTGVFTAPSVTTSTTYTITYTLPGCTPVTVGTITVAPCNQQPGCPTVTFTGRPTSNICPGTTVTLVPSVTGGTFGGTTAITSAGMFTAPNVTTATTYNITYTLPGCTPVTVGTITVAPCNQQPGCPYNITLVSRTYNQATNQTTFVWSVVNPNPGNGTNSTVQDLSHWGFSINPCTPSTMLDESDIVRAGYGTTSNATSHSSLDVDIKDDKSQECTGTTPVLKFDRGTSGSTPTYYSLVLTGNWGTGTLSAYYKSGVNTGCGLCTIPGAGVGCQQPTQPSCPTVTFTGLPTANICPAATATIVPSVTGGTFAVSVGGTAVSGVINASTGVFTAPSVTAATTYTITYTLPGCTPVPVGTITVAPCPPIPVCPVVTFTGLPTASICPGTTVTLGAIAAGSPLTGGTFAANVTGVVTAAGVFTAPSVTATTTYTITYTPPQAGCTPVPVGTITVVPQPTLVVANVTTAASCAGGSTGMITVASQSGVTYTLTRTGFTATLAGTGGNIVFTGLAAGTYSLTAANTAAPGCPVTLNNLTVGTVAAPTVTFTGAPTASVCPGTVVTLVPSVAGGTFGGTTAITAAGVFTAPGVTTSTTYTLTYTVTVGGCQFIIPAGTITVVPQPTLVLANVTTAATCPGGSTGTITVVSQTGVSYTIGATTIAGTGGNIVFTGLAAGTYSLTAANTAAPGCPVMVNVTVGTATAPSVTFTGLPTAAICPGTVVTLVPSVTGGTWTGTGVTAAGVFTAPSVTAQTSYTLTYTLTSGGCTYTYVVSINVAPLPVAPTNITVVNTCPTGAASGSIAFTSQAGVSYRIGTTTIAGTGGMITFSGLAAGNYTITATSTANCVTSFTATVGTVVAPTVTFTGLPTAAICPGTAVTLVPSVTGGTWTGTGVTAGGVFTAPSVTAQTSYTLTYTLGVSGCTFTYTATINVAPLPVVPAAGSITIVNACPNASNGSITFASQSGVSYRIGTTTIAGTGSNITFSGLAAGTYTITATSAAGCVASFSATVGTIVVPALTFTGVPSGQLCPGTQVTIVPSIPGGTWSGSTAINAGGVFTAPNVTVTTQYTLTYTATVNGCPVIGIVTITVVPAPTVPTPVIVNTCPGASSGSITFASQTGVSYVLSLGGTTVATLTGTGANITFSGLAAGAYTITASNIISTPQCATGCIVNACPVNFTVTVGTVVAPTVTFTGAPTAAICPGTVVTLVPSVTGGTWTGTGVTAGGVFTAPAVTAQTSYALTYTLNVSGCTFTYVVNITVAPTPVVPTNITIVNTCPGGSTGSIAFTSQSGVSYRIGTTTIAGTGSTITFTGLAAGTFTINATSTAGCVASFTATVGTVVAPTVTFTGLPSAAICPTTVVTLIPSVTGGTWSGTGITAGGVFTAPTVTTQTSYTLTYTLTVSGCTFTYVATINVAPLPTAPAAGSITIVNTCPGGSTGSIAFTSQSGVSYRIGTTTIAGTGGMITFSALAAGTYTITATSAAGCVTTFTATVGTVVAPTVTFTGVPSAAICPGAVVTLVPSVTGGSWTGTGVTAGGVFTAPTVTAQTSYTLTYTLNVSGCVFTYSVTIMVAPLPVVPTNITVVNTCPTGAASGSITFASQSGVSYRIGTTTIAGTGSNITFSGLAAGAYTITATSAAGCVATFSATVGTVVAPTVTFTGLPSAAAICPTTVVTLIPSVPGGTWSGTGITAGGVFTAPTVTTQTSYTLTYTLTSGGCTFTYTTTINVAPLPAPPATGNITIVNTCPGGSTGSIAFTSLTGVSYRIGTTTIAGTGSTITFSGLAAGTYTITATSAAGCVTTFTATVGTVVAPTVTFTGVPSAAICPGATATLAASVAGGTWTGTGVTAGGVFTAPTVTAQTSYTLTYTLNVSGCVFTYSVTIMVAPLPVAPTNITVVNTCPGASSGSIAFTSQSGVSYRIGTTTIAGTGGMITFSGLAAGNYTITATSAAGCITTFTASVGTVVAPTVTFTGAPSAAICPAAVVTLVPSLAGGTFSANVTGVITAGGVFTAPVVTAQTTYTLTYTVTVSGCTFTIPAGTITVAPRPVVPATTIVNVCPGASNGSIAFTSQTGVSYAIGTTTIAGTGSTITFGSLAAGTYTITATSTAGCVTTFTATVGTVVVTPCQITGPQAVCMGTTNQYTVTTGAGVTAIQWSVVSGNCIIVSNGTATASVKAVGQGTYVIRATVFYGSCTTSCEITINSTPLTVTAQPATVCPGTTTVNLVGSPTGGVWASTNPQIQAAINNTNSTFNATGIPAGTYPITYTVTQSNGCTGFTLTYITVLDQSVIGGLAGRVVASGSTGMEVTMKKSAKGIKYQLLRNGQKVGAPVEGTGSEISFGTQEVNGDYSVTASTQDGGCSTTGAAGRISPSGDPATARAGKLDVSAFPNPFNDRIRFTINSEYSGQGVLEVYNVLGAKIKTVYEGYIEAGRSQNVDFMVPGAQRVNMIYKLKVGNHETSGKLINVK